jgi:hypothetical protein
MDNLHQDNSPASPSLCADVMGVVADFLTLPEAIHIQPTMLPSNYIGNRIDAIIQLDGDEREAAFEKIFSSKAQVTLMFPELVKRLPDDSFPWRALLRECMGFDMIEELGWVVRNKQHVPAVSKWTRQWFKNLVGERILHSRDQCYVTNQELIWHQCCLALVDSSADPQQEWETLIVAVLQSGKGSSWLHWIINASRHHLFQKLGPDNFNNAMLSRLVSHPGVPMHNKKRVLAMFTRPVLVHESQPLLTDAIRACDADMCKELFVRLGATPSVEDKQYMAAHPDETKYIKLLFTYMETFGPERAMTKYCLEFESRREEDAMAYRVRKTEIEKRHKRRQEELEVQFRRDVDAAKLARDELMGQLQVEKQKHKRAATDEFIKMSRLLRRDFP